MQTKKDKEKKNLNIGVTFLTDQLLHVQVKLMELHNRPESRHAEYEVGEFTKQQKWPSTVVKTGEFLPFLCVVIVSVFFLTCVSSIVL